jgi:hypothetical protein
MDKRLLVFLIRAALGVAAGWFLARVFFKQDGWFLILVLAALVVGAAYLSEAWRLRRQNKG